MPYKKFGQCRGMEMRLKNVKGAREAVENSPLVIQEPERAKGKWNEVFGNGNPIRIEIGMGKGKFLHELAQRSPEINYIGIEKYSSVLIRALQRMDQVPLSNLLFIRMDAQEIGEVFGKEEIDRIYLNFSDPWPKERHGKRRLTSREFLSKYEGFLKKDGVLEFKTDNRDLFDFALEELSPAGWEAVKVTRDLHSDWEMGEGNIMTEYEEKFSSKGSPIYKYIIKRK